MTCLKADALDSKKKGQPAFPCARCVISKRGASLMRSLAADANTNIKTNTHADVSRGAQTEQPARP